MVPGRGSRGAPPFDATAAYLPSFSTRMTGFLRSLPDFAPRDVITTIGHSGLPWRMLPPGRWRPRTPRPGRGPTAGAGLVLAFKCHVPNKTRSASRSIPAAIASARMSAIDGVSEIFDADAWDVVPGFEDLTDLTYHRAKAHGTVRVAFDRPDILNAFRPHTVDELLRVLEHARTSSDVGCVILTGNGPSAKNGKWAFCTGGDQRIRGRAGYQYADGRDRRHRRQGQARPAAHPRGAAADPVHAQGRHLRGARLDRRRRPQPARRLRPDPRQRRGGALQADRRRRRLLRRRLRVGVPRPPGRPEVRPRDLLPRPGVLRRGRRPDGHRQPGRPARRARGKSRWSGAGWSTASRRPRSGC